MTAGLILQLTLAASRFEPMEPAVNLFTAGFFV